tara:strand:- start:906 stop:1091 length:186 start_codon:yes stop_codon:yes gene_type:complete
MYLFVWNDKSGNPLSFEDWCQTNDKELQCQFAETGADREMDFDMELESEYIYDNFRNHFQQ